MTYIVLGPTEVGLAALLLLLPAGLDLLLRLDLTRSVAVAAARTLLQLGMVGYLLRHVFALNRWYLVVPVLLFMVAVAARAAVTRSSRRVPGAALGAFATLLVATTFVTFTATELILGVDHWWAPQYVIPMAGMLLGNALTGVSLGMDRLLAGLVTERGAIEVRLTLGMPLWQATLPWFREAVRSGMVPILNAMTVVGLVSLPGMMTGQILAGADPLHAVAYQVLILFMIAATTALATMGLCLVVWRRLQDPMGRLRLEVIEVPPRR